LLLRLLIAQMFLEQAHYSMKSHQPLGVHS
jgi:hypothetical protein